MPSTHTFFGWHAPFPAPFPEWSGKSSDAKFSQKSNHNSKDQSDDGAPWHCFKIAGEPISFLGSPTQCGAGASGGALHLAAFQDGVTIPTRTSGVNFSLNSVSSNGPNTSNGGAIALNRGVSLSDTSSTLSSNSARNLGGGQAFGGGIATEGPLFLSGTKLFSNTALALRLSLFGPIGQGFGGGIAFFNNPLAQLTNVWFVGNLASTAGNNTYGIYHSNPI